MPYPICSNCSFHNPPGMRYCGNCGTRLPEKDTSVGVEATPVLHPGTMIGADLRDRLHKAGLEATGQRRNVTILFADITNYSAMVQKLADDETVYELVQQFLHTLAEDVYRFEGMVDKFTGDGLMAIFGAPISHENNAERAVRAAMDMQAGVAQLRQLFQEAYNIDLRIRIGLNAGTVIVGQVGSDLMMDYTAVGDTVNLASRLESAADPGSILVSEKVYRQTKPLFEFRKVQSLTLKGFDQPVTAYQVVGIKTTPGRVRGIEGLQAPLIGRDEDLNLLREAVETLLTQSSNQFVLVTGEAGIGKSRLTAELKNFIEPNEIKVIEGQSLTYRSSISYWIFQDMLRNYLGASSRTAENDLRKMLADRVTEVLGSEAVEVLPYLEYLLSLEPSDTRALNRIRFLEAEQLRQLIFLAVRDLLTAEAHLQPVMLILEDLHWADETSQDLIAYLLESTQNVPLLIYGISRPFKGGTMQKILDFGRNRMGDRFIHIQLRSLSIDQSSQLFFELLSIPELPVTFREQIVQRADGVPFYLEEILRMLIENQVIERDENRWKIASGAQFDSLGVPDTLQELILTRFDRLSRMDRSILQIASVIGKEFNISVLLEVMRDTLDKSQLSSILERLVEREFIMPRSTTSREVFVFRHVLTSDAIYSTMLKQERRLYHGMVAASIEQIFIDRLEGQVEILANHYLNSPNREKALHYLILAGQKAAHDYANEQARQNFEMALSFLQIANSTPEQALRIHKGLGGVLALVGEYQAARRHYHLALNAVEIDISEPHIHDRSTLQREIALTYERQGDFDRALYNLNSAEQILSETNLPLVDDHAKILSDIGWIHFRRGNIIEAEKFLSRALSSVKGDRHRDVIASIYNRLGGISFHKGNLAQASQYTRSALTLREEIGDIREVARSYNNLGLLAYEMGDWDDALQNYQKVIELQSRIGDIEALAISFMNIASLQIDLGDLKRARGNLVRGLSAAERSGAMFHIGVAKMYFGRLAIYQENYEDALSFLKESLKIFTNLEVRENSIDVCHLLGEVFLKLGNLEDAREWGQRSIKLVTILGTRSLGKSEQHGRALRLLGKVSTVEQDFETANRYFQSSLEIFRGINARLEEGKTLAELGRMASEMGEEKLAKDYDLESRAIFDSLGLKAISP